MPLNSSPLSRIVSTISSIDWEEAGGGREPGYPSIPLCSGLGANEASGRAAWFARRSHPQLHDLATLIAPLSIFVLINLPRGAGPSRYRPAGAYRVQAAGEHLLLREGGVSLVGHDLDGAEVPHA